MIRTSAKPVIFISFSHEDEPANPVGGAVAWLSFVRTYLQPAVKDGIIELFIDENLRGGDALDAEIERKLRACDIFILLVSASSMASDYVVDIEIRIIRERQARGDDVHFYPLLIKPTPDVALDKLKDMVIRPGAKSPLSSFPPDQRLEQINAIANEIAAIAGGVVERKPAPPKRAPQPAYASISGLPETGYERLVGRDAELKRLDEAWSDDRTNILSLVAEGGAGKSALVNEWLKRLQADNYRGAEAVLGWSFYSQGSKERATSAEGFLNWALEKLGIKLETTSANTKGEAIAEAMAKRRVLLLLDGVEPLQHGPGPQVGQLKDLGLRSLLRRFAAVAPADAHGLIVLTSRIAIADIARWKDASAPVKKVDELTKEAGAALLRDNGVWGTDKELRKASDEFGGHPLALGLLASFLKETQFGDVRRRDHITAWVHDQENPRHGHAKRVMESYEREWLKDQPVPLAILHMVGLFDRPASSDCLEALRAKPAIKGLTDEIVKLGADDWTRAVDRLREVRLLAPVDPSATGALDAHPLVREWFGERLKQEKEKAWREAQGRIYEHLRDATNEGEAPTLDQLMPLYQAIAHGCRAARYPEALIDIYVNRICRRLPGGQLEFYAMHRLGGHGSDLAAISWFFTRPYDSPVAALEDRDQAWVVGVAAFTLRTQGRLAEASLAQRVALRRAEKSEDWSNAAIRASNLSDVELLSGEVLSAVISAGISVEYGDRSKQMRHIVVRRAVHANALNAAGRRREAGVVFADAEARQQQDQPQYSILYSVQGYQYCDFLLAGGEWSAVRVRSERALARQAESGRRLDGALALLASVRASVGSALENALRQRFPEQPGQEINDAAKHLAKVVEDLSVGTNDFIPVGFLARAVFRRGIGDWTGAARDLEEVEEIAEPGLMRLFLCDMALERARLNFAKIEAFAPLNGMLEQDNPPKPKELSEAEKATLTQEADKQLKIAADYVATCGYHRRDEELAELQAVLRGERKFAELPPRV